MSLFGCVCMCGGAEGSQKGVSSPLELESQVTVSCLWVLETELGPLLEQQVLNC